MKSIAAFQAAECVVEDEWLALRSNPVAVLLIGSPQRTSPVIAAMLPAWPAPIEICQAVNFTPDSAVRTLVLQDAGEMSPARQAALLEWMSGAPNRRRVITTVLAPLFPRVESGLFSKELYYRLNTITIDVRDASRQRLLAAGAGVPSGGSTT